MVLYDLLTSKITRNIFQMECNNNVVEGSLEQVQESVQYVKSKIGNMVPELGIYFQMTLK